MTVRLFVMKLVRKWNCYNAPPPRMPLRLASLILLCAGSSLLCGLFSSCGEQELLSSCDAWASHCSGFSRGVWAQLLHGMWDLPGPGLKSLSPALADSLPLNHQASPGLDFVTVTNGVGGADGQIEEPR